MKNLTLRQLRVFDALAETLSHSAAAERLGITQPAVSMLIRQLEADAGLPLLIRRGRRMDLTSAGTVLLQHARAILEHARRVEETLASMKGRHARPPPSGRRPDRQLLRAACAKASRKNNLIKVEECVLKRDAD